MSFHDTEYSNLASAIQGIQENDLIQRLLNLDPMAVTEISSDYLLAQAVEQNSEWQCIFTDAKTAIIQSGRPTRQSRRPVKFSPERRDDGRKWTKGSGAAAPWGDRHTPTDIEDWITWGDGALEIEYDPPYDPNEESYYSDSE